MKPMSGYIMVDATDLDISDTEAQTVDGLYDKLDAALGTGKEIILTGVVNGDAELSPTSVTCSTSESGITITMPGFTATVASTDVVTPVSDGDEPTP